MLRRLLAAAAAIIVGLGFTVTSASSASAEAVYECNDFLDRCNWVLYEQPSDPPYSPDENGWTAGAPTCYMVTSEEYARGGGWTEQQIYEYRGWGFGEWYVTIGCGTLTGYWSNGRQCYVSMVDGVWPARPAGFSSEAGYYRCDASRFNLAGFPPRSTPFFWSDTVPPGLQVYSPARAAAILIGGFQLRGIDVGMAPQVNPEWGHRRSYVGVPVWLWVDNPQPLTYGPYSETATLGGQTITATAQVTSIRWDMGDGAQRVCGSTGTEYNEGYGFADSPTCGYRYQQTSQSQPDDRFNVTATSQWVVTWTSVSGANGTVNLTTDSTVPLEVNEVQTVNVSPNGKTGP